MNAERTQMIPCPVCEGNGSWEQDTGRIDWDCGAPITHQVTCDECGGTGGVEVELQLITIDDLDEIEEPAK